MSLGNPVKKLAAQTISQKQIDAPKKILSFQPSVGLNKFDLFMQYIGTGDSSYLKVTRAMARKAIVDAKNIGVSYMRISATGYVPASINARGDLDLWLSNPAEYWNRYDTMMNDLNANGVKIVPVFVWNWTQFPCMAGETPAQLITNSGSKSYKLLANYIADFISHYGNNPTTYFYELTCELNLYADLKGNFSTDQMIAFTKGLAAFIKTLDSNHLISSGFSMPRPAAEHLRNQPDWSAKGADWTTDSYKEFQKNIADIHDGIDIVSVHFYNDGDQERFGIYGTDNAGLLNLVKQITDSLGKILYVGEYGDVSPYITKDSKALFSQSVLNKIVELNIPLSSPWVWEFYQSNTYTYTSFNLEPGYTDLIIEKIKDANLKLGNSVPSLQAPDTTSPQVVLTWPLEGATMDTTQLINAVASDNNGSIAKVEILVDHNVVTSVTKPPYQVQYKTKLLSAGEHLIEAVAYDTSGNAAKYAANVIMPVATSVEKTNKNIPNMYVLNQNYPNPFNPSTSINYQLPVTGHVTLKVYDIIGREVASLVDEVKAAGNYNIKFNGSALSSGVYFYRLRSGAFVETKKLILMK
jgi:hypothetical protein